MTAAEYFTKTAANIVKATGCTVEQAVDTLLARMATERPELLAKVAAGAFAA
jgi:hypothetical protein